MNFAMGRTNLYHKKSVFKKNHTVLNKNSKRPINQSEINEKSIKLTNQTINDPSNQLNNQTLY